MTSGISTVPGFGIFGPASQESQLPPNLLPSQGSVTPSPTIVSKPTSVTLVNTTIIKTVSVMTVTASADPTHNVNDDRQNLGTIIGIVVGIVVVILFLIGGILFFFKRRRHAQRRRGLLNVQSSNNPDKFSSLFLEGIIPTPNSNSNLNFDTTAGDTSNSNPNGLWLHNTTRTAQLRPAFPGPGVPQLLTTADSNLGSESGATGRSREATDPDSNSSSNYYNATLLHRDPERYHTDSGIRVGGGALLAYEYDDGENTEWSVQSKDRFPPVYTQN